jgi:hypothetical protein
LCMCECASTSALGTTTTTSSTTCPPPPPPPLPSFPKPSHVLLLTNALQTGHNYEHTTGTTLKGGCLLTHQQRHPRQPRRGQIHKSPTQPQGKSLTTETHIQQLMNLQCPPPRSRTLRITQGPRVLQRLFTRGQSSCLLVLFSPLRRRRTASGARRRRASALPS